MLTNEAQDPTYNITKEINNAISNVDVDAEFDIYEKDDIIKTVGEKVSPKEVENVLYEMEDILEAAVISIPDEILGNAIKAVVALKKNSKLTKEKIILHCSNYLEKFMIPKYVEIRSVLPKTSTGKISKKDLC